MTAVDAQTALIWGLTIGGMVCLIVASVILLYRRKLRAMEAAAPPAPRRIEGFGDGDLRIDKPVDPSHLDMMIGDALADHGFDVTHVEVTEEWTHTGGGRLMAGTARAYLGIPNGEWSAAIEYEVIPARKHGVYDFSDLYVVLFIEPGWKRALEPEVKAGG